MLTVPDSGEDFLWGHSTKKSKVSPKKIICFCIADDVCLRVDDVSFALALRRQILNENPAAWPFLVHILWVDSPFY